MHTKESNKNSGISIDNNIRITSEAGVKNRWAFLILQIGIIYLGITGVIYGFASGLDLYFDKKALFIGIAVTEALFLLIGELKKASIYIGCGYLLVLAGLIYKYHMYLANGFYCMENAIIRYAVQYYGIEPLTYIVDEDPMISTTFMLLLMTQLIGMVVVIEVYKHYMRTVYAFCIAIFFGTLLALGITPPAICLTIVIFVMIVMHAMDGIPNSLHKASRKEVMKVGGRQWIRLKSALTMSVLLLLLLGIVRVFMSQEHYEDKMNVTERKLELQHAITNFSFTETVQMVKDRWNAVNPFSNNSKASGGLDSGRIGDVGTVSFTNEVALKVAVDPMVSFLYLKGFAGASYEGDEWADVSAADTSRYNEIMEDYGEEKHNGETLLWEWMNLVQSDLSEQMMSLGDGMPGINIMQSDVSVSYVHANKKFLYAPYTSNYLGLGELRGIADQYIRPVGEKGEYYFADTFVGYNDYTNLNQLLHAINYASKYYQYTYSESYKSFAAFEKEYRKYVYDVYTRLPKKGLDQLKQLEFYVSGLGTEYTVNVVDEVIDYLRRTTKYSLSPGVPKKGQDFAEYFLFDKKEGFCSHYATAAVLLLRNQGIPARYVEGYIVTDADIRNGTDAIQKIADITDANAHAWVEVYFDGVGWIPVEVTNGYTEDGASDVLDEIKSAADGITPTVTPTSTPTPTVEATPTPTAAPTPTPTIAPTVSPTVTLAPGISPTITPDGSESGIKFDFKAVVNSLIFRIILVIVGILLLFALRCYIIKKHRQSRFHHGSKNHRALEYMKEIQRILFFMKVEKEELISYEEYASYVSQKVSFLPEGFDRVLMLCLTARFDCSQLSKEELRIIVDYYKLLRQEFLKAQSKSGRIWYKYWKVI